jgi:hypothetical protein
LDCASPAALLPLGDLPVRNTNATISTITIAAMPAARDTRAAAPPARDRDMLGENIANGFIVFPPSLGAFASA